VNTASVKLIEGVTETKKLKFQVFQQTARGRDWPSPSFLQLTSFFSRELTRKLPFPYQEPTDSTCDPTLSINRLPPALPFTIGR
jgi:hypothetical protein